jgi:hypothetical protein
MSEEQFTALHQFTLDSALSSENFGEKLLHFIRYLVQAVIVFGCLRGRDEISLCQVDEFSIIDDYSFMFQMKRQFKSLKLDASYNVVHKPSRVILGQRYVEILRLLLDKRKSGPSIKNARRLWLKPLPAVSSSSAVYWSDIPIGKTSISQAVSVYVKKLHGQKHALFLDCPHFTNSSLRKYHIERLSEAGAPLVVQQASLAQNVKSYARGAHSLPLQKKVAEIVAGQKKRWQEDTNPSETSPQQSPAKKKKTVETSPPKKLESNIAVIEHQLPASLAVSSSSGQLKISIVSGEKTFSFEYVL